MRDYTRLHVTRAHAALAAAAAFVLILLTPSALDAQTPAMREREAKRQEAQARQWALRNIDKIKNVPPENPNDTGPTFAEVARDFEQLQLVNNTLAGAAQQGGGALDYDVIKKHSGEVRKRASRLKSCLALPEVKEQEVQLKVPETRTPAALKSAVASLDALVNAFAWNPVFHQTNVVDLEHSTKAAHDLAGIISLSEHINKSAGEMSKLAKREAKEVRRGGK